MFDTFAVELSIVPKLDTAGVYFVVLDFGIFTCGALFVINLITSFPIFLALLSLVYELKGLALASAVFRTYLPFICG